MPALPFAVGMYIAARVTRRRFSSAAWCAGLPIDSRGKSASEAETETSPGVLLSSGYIAGGTLCGLIIAFFVFLPERFNESPGSRAASVTTTPRHSTQRRSRRW